MGRPSKCEEVKAALLRIIFRVRAAHEQILPGERDLAGMTGVSRATVRKVLDELEKDGVISRDNQMTCCLPLKKQNGRYAFCAAGSPECRYFYFELYRRLWETLSAAAGELEIDLIFLPWKGTGASGEILTQLSGYDIIFVSYINPDIIETMIRARLPLVMLDEQNKCADFPLAALDNTAVGELAAEKLIKAGCRNALVIEFCIGGSYAPFESRFKGFVKIFEKHGGKVNHIANDQESDNPLTCLSSLAEKMEPYLDSETDSVFYLSDEMTGMLNWYWMQNRRIPEELKIISFLGSGDLYRHHPQPDHIAMDNDAVAAVLLNMIEMFERKRVVPEIRHQLIAPVFNSISERNI